MLHTVLLSLTQKDRPIRQWRLVVDDALCIAPPGETVVDLALCGLMLGSTLEGLDSRAASMVVADTVSRGFSGIPGLVPARAVFLDEIPNGYPLAHDGALSFAMDGTPWVVSGNRCFTLLSERGVDRLELAHHERFTALHRRNYGHSQGRPTHTGEPGTLSTLYGLPNGLFDPSNTALDSVRAELALALGITRGLRLAQSPLPIDGEPNAMWRTICALATHHFPILADASPRRWQDLIERGVLTTNRAWAPTFVLEGPAMADTVARFLKTADQTLCDVWALGAELAQLPLSTPQEVAVDQATPSVEEVSTHLIGMCLASAWDTPAKRATWLGKKLAQERIDAPTFDAVATAWAAKHKDPTPATFGARLRGAVA